MKRIAIAAMLALALVAVSHCDARAQFGVGFGSFGPGYGGFGPGMGGGFGYGPSVSLRVGPSMGYGYGGLGGYGGYSSYRPSYGVGYGGYSTYRPSYGVGYGYNSYRSVYRSPQVVRGYHRCR